MLQSENISTKFIHFKSNISIKNNHLSQMKPIQFPLPEKAQYMQYQRYQM